MNDLLRDLGLGTSVSMIIHWLGSWTTLPYIVILLRDVQDAGARSAMAACFTTPILVSRLTVNMTRPRDRSISLNNSLSRLTFWVP